MKKVKTKALTRDSSFNNDCTCTTAAKLNILSSDDGSKQFSYFPEKKREKMTSF